MAKYVTLTLLQRELAEYKNTHVESRDSLSNAYLAGQAKHKLGVHFDVTKMKLRLDNLLVQTH